MYLKDLQKEFLFDCEIRKLSTRTMKSYRNNLGLFIQYIENEMSITELENVSSAIIKKYFQYLIKKGLKESYVNGILKVFRAFYKYCVREEYVLKSPCDKVPWQKEGTVLIKTFSDEEVVKMLDVYNFSDFLNARNKTMLAFLIDTGARNYETCCLMNSDIKDTFILIHGKGNKERYVGISPQLKKHLIKYERVKEYFFKDKNLKYDNYFLSRNGLPLTVEAIERVIREAGRIAGVRDTLRCSPHTCRHYFAQAQLRNGLDVYSLSRLLGHENIMITKRYLQSLEDKDIVEKSIKTSPLMNLK